MTDVSLHNYNIPSSQMAYSIMPSIISLQHQWILWTLSIFPIHSLLSFFASNPPQTPCPIILITLAKILNLLSPSIPGKNLSLHKCDIPTSSYLRHLRTAGENSLNKQMVPQHKSSHQLLAEWFYYLSLTKLLWLFATIISNLQSPQIFTP